MWCKDAGKETSLNLRKNTQKRSQGCPKADVHKSVLMLVHSCLTVSLDGHPGHAASPTDFAQVTPASGHQKGGCMDHGPPSMSPLEVALLWFHPSGA